MPRYSNSNNTTISLKYCYEELLKLNPQMTKTEFAVLIGATRQNICQRLSRDSKLNRKERIHLKEQLEEQKDYYDNLINDYYKPISPYEMYGVSEHDFY